MIYTVDPRQTRLSDPFDRIIPPAGRKIIGNGWQATSVPLVIELSRNCLHRTEFLPE